MADNLRVHEGQASDPQLRTKDTGAGHMPINVVGQHVRTNLTPFSLTLTASSQALTLPAGTTHADIYCEGGSSTDYARFWDGGSLSAPSSNTGMKLKDHELFESASPSTFRALNGSGACQLRVQPFYYA